MSRNNRLFSPRQSRSITTYPQQPQARIDARAPLSRVDQLAQDRGTNAAPAADWSKTFRPAGQREGMQGTGAPKPLDVNTPAIQGLLDKAAGIAPKSTTAQPNPGAVARATGQQQATPYGTVGTGRAPAAPDGTVIKDASGKEIGIAGSPQQGPAAPTLEQTRASTLAQHPEIGVAGSPENKAFVAYAKSINPATGQPNGEAGAHQNIDSVMKPFVVGPAAPTPSEIAATQYTEGKEAKAKADAGPFQPDSIGGRLVSSAKNAPSLSDSVGNAVASGAKAIGLNDDASKAAGDVVRNGGNAVNQGLTDAADTAGSKIANLFTPKTPDPKLMAGGSVGGTTAQTADSGAGGAVAAPAQPPAIAASEPKEEVPSLAAGSIPYKVDPATGKHRGVMPFVPSMANNKPMDEDVPNFAGGFNPDPAQPNAFTPSAPTGDLAGEASFKSNATAGNLAAENNLKAAGYGDTPVTTQALAGHPEDTAHGYGQEEGWDKAGVPNYAKGKLFAPAMAREKKAIAHHVGGAPKSAKPVPVVMAGQPAVLNSSEAVVPNAAGGMPAVLNRNQQKRMFAPSRR